MTGRNVLRLIAIGALSLAMTQPGLAASCKKLCKQTIKDCQGVVGTPGGACTGLKGKAKKDCKKHIVQARKNCKKSALSDCKDGGGVACDSASSAFTTFN